jgi:hypothetical protein
MKVLEHEANRVQPEIGELIFGECPDIRALDAHRAGVGTQDS